MVAVINDPLLEEQLIAERRATGADRYDEVWEGVYIMAPMANNEHQELVGNLTAALTAAVGWTGLGNVLPGTNVSDYEDDWTQNYRCPDVAVFLKDTKAIDRGTHWFGGPDFAVEIVSPGDQTRDKLEFYAAAHTRELLIVDRDPWALELFRLENDRLVSAGRSTVEQPTALRSEIVPLSLALVAGEKRPRIAIAHSDGKQHWTA